jgi:poly(3-hydroxybutyrate) depolymerase
MSGHLWESGLETWRAVVQGSNDYWLRKLGASPWELADDATRWWSAIVDRREPAWSSPNEVVLSTPFAALRDFSRGSRAKVTPTLVLPPQAGHHSCIVDYSAEQSQLATIREAGLARLWSAEWLGATQATKHTAIGDYLDFLERCLELIGEPVNLIGDCQGGWLAAIYAALHPDQVNTLTLAGSPIDFHAGEGPIHESVELLCATGDTSFYEALVASGAGVMSGDYILGGFIAIKPENEVAKHLQLLVHLDDPGHRQRYRDFEDWFKFTQDIAGDFFLWIVRELFRDNKLIGGELEIRGERVDLSRLRMPLNLLAGATDHITPPPQVFAAREAVGTPARDVTTRTTSGGHLGLFMGREALREHWPPILADVLACSR